MRAYLENNFVKLSFAYDPAIVAFIRLLPVRKYDPRTKSWSIPLSAINEVQLRNLEKLGFYVDSTIYEAIGREKLTLEALDNLSGSSDTALKSVLPLLPFQRVGAEFLLKSGSALLAFEQGLGKTITMLEVCEQTQVRRVLYFCPAILKWQVAEEIKKFIPNASISVITGLPEQRKRAWLAPATYYIANYELLLRPEDFFQMTQVYWDYIIADEATRLSNPWNKQSKAIRKLNSVHRIAATGTPIQNSAADMYGILSFCNPGCLGNYRDFLERYSIRNPWGGISSFVNMDELRKRVRRYMIRRTKVEVLPELPPLTETDVLFELSAEERKLYDQLRAELLFEVEKSAIDKIKNPVGIQNTLTKMIVLRELVCSPEIIGQMKKSSKLEALKEILSEIAVPRKVLVFCEFAQMCKILKRELEQYNPAMIIGEIPDQKRQEELAKFKGDPSCRILISSSAGQYGLNLSEASTVINFDQTWSISRMDQRSARAHRIGQKNPVQVIHLLARHSIDEYMRKVLRKKQKQADQILLADIKEMLAF